jgi:hypothetical protein
MHTLAADPNKWVAGITRYGSANLAAVFPGINAQYTIDANGVLTLNLLLAAGVDPKAVQFQIPGAFAITVAGGGSLTAQIGAYNPIAFVPTLVYRAPVAVQSSGPGQVSRGVNFAVQSANTFGLVVQGLNPAQPLQISIQVNGASSPFAFSGGVSATDAAGNTFLAASVADAAGNLLLSLSSPSAMSGVGTPLACRFPARM